MNNHTAFSFYAFYAFIFCNKMEPLFHDMEVGIAF